MAIVDYTDVRRDLDGVRSHVLLGNGFSIGCDRVFRYESLYEAARAAGLSEKAVEIFERVGTNNFERVMRVLDDSEWVGRLYGLPLTGVAAMRQDLRAIKTALVEAVAKSHLAHSGLVSDDKKAAALTFLAPFHNVFTTNYDLVLYWVAMHQKPVHFRDGFGNDADDPEAPYVVFVGRSNASPGILYLHGALHLHEAGSDIRKHCWNRSGIPLTDLIRAGMEKREYPLFVAEGLPDKKLEQIGAHGYLFDCLQSLMRISSPLVVYGHALGPSDQHLADAIVQSNTQKVFIGLHGDPGSGSNREIRRSGERMEQHRARLRERSRRVKSLTVAYYRSESANVWGDEN